MVMYHDADNDVLFGYLIYAVFNTGPPFHATVVKMFCTANRNFPALYSHNGGFVEVSEETHYRVFSSHTRIFAPPCQSR